MEERADLYRTKDATKHTVIVYDLSSGGACISSELRFAKGEDLTLTISAGRNASFTLGCSVIFARQKAGRIHSDYGVRFIRVRPGDLERLRAFVASHDDARHAAAAFI
jgi:PilZ domain